jgi:phosphate transport system protein
MVLAEHTTRAFDADLRELARMTAEMGGGAERQLVDAMDALLTRNCNRGRSVVAADEVLDSQHQMIEQKAIATIAVRQPVAIDLRDVVGILRIANNLERIGDLAKNIGKRVVALNGGPMPPRALGGMRHMTELTLNQLRDVLDAFAERDGRKAIAIWRRDQEIDAIYTSLFRELLSYMMEDPGTITFGIHLLFCSKNIERIGDHATNIAEAIYYMVEGDTLASERPKADATSLTEVVFEAFRI